MQKQRSTDEKMKKIGFIEPWFFIFFGIFNLHRIWGLFDRKSYADFWVGVMERKDWFYYCLMAFLAIFCILGIIIFLKNRKNNFWWRWIYVFGGCYVLFDLFAIAAGLNFWHELILQMYDVNSPYWNLIWSLFILIGGAVFILGVRLLKIRNK